MLLSLHSVAQHSWYVIANSCSTIEVGSTDLNRSDASVMLYENSNGFYTIKQRLRLERGVNSVSFTDLPNSIYRTVIIFDQNYEGEYTLWNANANTSADIYLDCLELRKGKTSMPQLILEPNPTSNTVRILFDNKDNEVIKSKIFSVNGTIVKQFNFTESPKEIQLESFPTGLYFVQFIINNITITKKLIKI